MRRSSRRRDRANDLSHADELLKEFARPERADTPSIRHRVLKAMVEDRRQWAPGGQRTPRDAVGRPARIIHAPQRQRPHGPAGKAKSPSLNARVNWTPRASFRFETGAKVLLCVKRSIRRQVLHALKKTTAGRGLKKRRNEWSLIRC